MIIIIHYFCHFYSFFSTPGNVTLVNFYAPSHDTCLFILFHETRVSTYVTVELEINCTQYQDNFGEKNTEDYFVTVFISEFSPNILRFTAKYSALLISSTLPKII